MCIEPQDRKTPPTVASERETCSTADVVLRCNVCWKRRAAAGSKTTHRAQTPTFAGMSTEERLKPGNGSAVTSTLETGSWDKGPRWELVSGMHETVRVCKRAQPTCTELTGTGEVGAQH